MSASGACSLATCISIIMKSARSTTSTALDRILDFLVANQIKPMIEIANKNKVLSRSSHDKRKVAPSETNLFYSNDLIEYFFHELAVHLIDRYGQVEGRKLDV